MVSSGTPGAPARTDPWEPFLGPIALELARRLADLGLPEGPGPAAPRPELSDQPDRDAELPLHRVAKSLGVAAADLATRLSEDFPRSVGLRRAFPSGAYLNFEADPAWLARETLELVLERRGTYGHRARSLPGTCVEHTSANPTGPFHVGRIRNGIIGDTLARTLRAAGSPVVTQYYVDDLGRQAAMVSWIWSIPRADWPAEIDAAARSDGDPGDPAERADVRYGRPYPAVSAYLKSHPEAAAAVAEITRRLETGDPPPNHLPIARATLEAMLSSLARIGITFDEFVWESSFLTDGGVDRVMERLRSAPHALVEENGALAIDATPYGLPKEKATIIVARANGTSLYAPRDIAYHLQKFARFPRVIDVLGQDHRLHARTLEALLTEIGEPRRPEFILYQDLVVPEGGRMSARKGTAVYLDHLLDEAVERARAEVRGRWPDADAPEVDRIATAVAAGAVRYHILRVAPEKAVAFRWEDALAFEGRSGPFLQYAFVRATSLLRKAEADADPPTFRGEDLSTPSERALVRTIARLPRTVEYSARTAHVHTLAGYGYELAESFNRFYESVPVLKADGERSSRLCLVWAARETLGNTLDLLGLPRLDRM